MDITLTNTVTKEKIQIEGIKYLPKVMNYYNFTIVFSQLVRRHKDIIAEMQSYRKRLTDANGNKLVYTDISEFDLRNLNRIKQGIAICYNEYRDNSVQIELYKKIYDLINVCYVKYVSLYRGISKDEVMIMLFRNSGINIEITNHDLRQRSLDNNMADCKLNEECEQYNRLFLYNKERYITVKTEEQDKGYTVHPDIYKTMADDIKYLVEHGEIAPDPVSEAEQDYISNNVEINNDIVWECNNKLNTDCNNYVKSGINSYKVQSKTINISYTYDIKDDNKNNTKYNTDIINKHNINNLTYSNNEQQNSFTIKLDYSNSNNNSKNYNSDSSDIIDNKNVYIDRKCFNAQINYSSSGFKRLIDTDIGSEHPPDTDVIDNDDLFAHIRLNSS